MEGTTLILNYFPTRWRWQKWTRPETVQEKIQTGC